jgi:hypothetical protein
VIWLRRCLVDGMKLRFRVVDLSKSRNPLALSRQRAKQNVKNATKYFCTSENFGLNDLYSRINLYDLLSTLCNAILLIINSSNAPNS